MHDQPIACFHQNSTLAAAGVNSEVISCLPVRWKLGKVGIIPWATGNNGNSSNVRVELRDDCGIHMVEAVTLSVVHALILDEHSQVAK